jgi:hypothetical protein
MPQTAPAQPPQNVVSNTRDRLLKCESMSQPENTACGSPQVEGPWSLDGIEERGKDQIEMLVGVIWVAQMPPPALLKDVPGGWGVSGLYSS